MKEFEYFDQVLAAALQGDEEAKVELTELLRPMIVAQIRRYCPIYEEYMDLYQDGIVIVLECLGTYNPKYSFLKYVQSHLKYYYLDTYRYLVRLECESVTTPKEQDLVDLLQSDMDLEGEVIRREEMETLERALNFLTPRQSLIVRLFYFEHLGIVEIASFLQISYWTVVNTKRRAMKSLYLMLTKDRMFL